MLVAVSNFYTTPGVTNLANPTAGQFVFVRGSSINYANSTADGGDIYAVQLQQANITDTTLTNGIVNARIPWASSNRSQNRLTLDTNLFNQPIMLQVQFRGPPVRSDPAWFPVGALENFTQNAKELKIFYEQVELIDKSLSLRDKLLAQPNYNVGLPFQFLQSVPFQITQGYQIISGYSSTNNMFNITSMMNSDLTTIFLQVQEPINNNPLGNHCDFVALQDLELWLNGQQFTIYAAGSYNGVQAIRSFDDPEVDNHVVAMRQGANALSATSLIEVGAIPADGVNPAVPGVPTVIPLPKAIGIYEFNMSLIRAVMNESNMVNTPRFTNMTFQIKYKIPPNVYSRCAYYPSYLTLQEPSQIYTAYMTYAYNAVFQFGGNGGTSTLYT
jgi:hypothetical protein